MTSCPAAINRGTRYVPICPVLPMTTTRMIFSFLPSLGWTGKNSRTQEVEKSRSQGVKESRSQGVKESRSQGVKESRSQGVKESRSQQLQELRRQKRVINAAE